MAYTGAGFSGLDFYRDPLKKGATPLGIYWFLYLYFFFFGGGFRVKDLGLFFLFFFFFLGGGC